MVTDLDRLGRCTINIFGLPTTLRNVNLCVLTLGGGLVDTGTVTSPVVFTLVAALAELELEINKERINDSARKRRKTGGNLGRRPQVYTDVQIHDARGRLHAGTASTRLLAKEFRMSQDAPQLAHGSAAGLIVYAQLLQDRVRAAPARECEEHIGVR